MNKTRLFGTVACLVLGSSLAFAETPAPAAPAKAPPAAAPTMKAQAAPTPPAPAAKPAPAPGSKPAAPSAPAMAPKAAEPAKPAAAPAAEVPPAPKPAPELAQLDFLVGNWKCDMTQKASQWAPEHAFKASVKAKKTLDNFWIQSEYKEQKSKVHPMAMSSTSFMGYDTTAKSVISMGVDNGGGWMKGKSKGFEGDKMVIISDANMMNMNVGVRETVTKTGPKALTWAVEIAMEKGKWTAIGEGLCKK